MTSAVEVFGAYRGIAIVLGVARLGDAGLRGWWRCHGFDQAGEYVLSGSFRRTWRCAAMELDVMSAARRHDEVLPRPTALHLFSDGLPFRRLATSWLAEMKTASEAPLLDTLVGWDLELGSATLGEWAGEDADGAAQRVGPALCLGNLAPAALQDDPTLEAVCRKLAAAYLGQGAEFAPPYYDLTA